MAAHRSCGIRCPRRLVAHHRSWTRRQPRQRAPLQRPQCGIARTQQRAGVDPRGDGPWRAGPRPGGPRRVRIRPGVLVERAFGAFAAAGIMGGRLSMKPPLLGVAQLLVGGVDLRHRSCCALLHSLVAARDVGVMLAGEAAPGGLDGFRRGIDGQPENGEGVSRWHPDSLPAEARTLPLDILPCLPSPCRMTSRQR